MSNLDLRKEMRCTVKFYYRLGKTDPKTIKLLNETFKDKCFDESAGKKERLSIDLTPKLGCPESVVNAQNIY